MVYFASFLIKTHSLWFYFLWLHSSYLGLEANFSTDTVIGILCVSLRLVPIVYWTCLDKPK